MTDPYRTASPMPKTLIEKRMDSHDASRNFFYGELSKWASRTTWNLAAIGLLMVAICLLAAYVADQQHAIRQLQHDVDQLRCEQEWHAPAGVDRGVVP